MNGVNARHFASMSLCMVVACASGPEPEPYQPPPPADPVAQEPPPPEPEPPPLPKIAVFDIRSVETERMPKATVDEAFDKLRVRLRASGKVEVLTRDNIDDPEAATEACFDEACQFVTGTELGAEAVLHSRLIQYDDDCVLVSVLYDVQTEKSSWGFSRKFTCTPETLTESLTELAAGLTGRDPIDADAAVFAVMPVQHRIRPIEWASESMTEYMSTLVAASGRSVVPSSSMSAQLGAKASRTCPAPKCAVEMAKEASASVSVALKITKKGRNCITSAQVIDVATKTSSASAEVTTPCVARDIAQQIDQLSRDLLP